MVYYCLRKDRNSTVVISFANVFSLEPAKKFWFFQMSVAFFYFRKITLYVTVKDCRQFHISLLQFYIFVNHASLCIKFQLVTICNQFITFFSQTVFENFPIVWSPSAVRLLGQNPDNINNGVIPCFTLGNSRFARDESFYWSIKYRSGKEKGLLKNIGIFLFKSLIFWTNDIY